MNMRKMYLMTLNLLFLFGHAPQQFAMEYVKNKISSALSLSTKTIKSDLGFVQPKVAQPSSLTKDFITGCRLACYGFAANMAVSYLTSKLIPLSSLPPQFEKGKEPSFVSSIIIAPIVEEIVCTYGISRLFGEKYGQVIVPLIFGGMHYHDDPKRWAFNIAMTGCTSFLHIRNFHSKENSIRASIFSHAIHNAIAWYY